MRVLMTRLGGLPVIVLSSNPRLVKLTGNRVTARGSSRLSEF